jgi:hypothetical protein
MAALLLPVSAVFGLAGVFSSSRVITGTLLIACGGPFSDPHVFKYLNE